MNVSTPQDKLTAKDYASDQEVRWCPGCGDYAILKAMQKTLADLKAKREDTVFISGIGCSSRFPYYMSSYGFHTIHGRAPAIATGIKLANPDLDVWLVTGDGDGMSIGGNHMLHVLRRNVDMQILLFNNEIYGLTKGQYSPTSRLGTRSPSTPGGSIDSPVHPTTFALGSGARFIARSTDKLMKHMPVMFERALQHKGASFVEILQNCIIYNDAVFEEFTDKSQSPETTLMVEHGKPMVFGKDGEKGIRIKPGTLVPEVVTLGEDGVSEADLLVHDETDATLAHMLTTLAPPEFPLALGVLYCDPTESYENRVHGRVEDLPAEQIVDRAAIKADMDKIFLQTGTWTVE